MNGIDEGGRETRERKNGPGIERGRKGLLSEESKKAGNGAKSRKKRGIEQSKTAVVALGASIYDVLKMFRCLDPLLPCHIQNSRNLVPYICFLGDPPPTADVIYGSPLVSPAPKCEIRESLSSSVDLNELRRTDTLVG